MGNMLFGKGFKIYSGKCLLKRRKMKKGFTVLEIIIALTILVIIFSLMTLFYVRGARTRNIITAYNEVGEILSQMSDTISNGRKGIPGLKDGFNVCSNLDPSHKYNLLPPFLPSDATGSDTLIFSNNTSTETLIYFFQADNGTDTSLYQIHSSDWKRIDLNPNKKIYLLSDSKFEYYDPAGRNIISEKLNTETTLVKIILVGKSTNPAMKKMVPMRIETLVRLKNKTSF
jgi:prepilin-type N-terminal cleavage/methylation domain-containing protein